MIDTLENIGIKDPVNIRKNEYYEIDYTETLDLRISFNEEWIVEEQKGKLFLDFIGTWKNCKCKYPFDIKRGDNYEQICEKIGKPAKYYQSFSNDFRTWELTNENGKTFVIGIGFEDDSLKTMNAMTIRDFSNGNANNMYEELE